MAGGQPFGALIVPSCADILEHLSTHTKQGSAQVRGQMEVVLYDIMGILMVAMVCKQYLGDMNNAKKKKDFQKEMLRGDRVIQDKSVVGFWRPAKDTKIWTLKNESLQNKARIIQDLFFTCMILSLHFRNVE